ncbi:hypothetical protein, partial [Nocardia abscessus]|uniref:hypothetical protein n=1 Tax=Nocardia abscessus TaxID=120957 RepID=UPI0024553C13
MMRTLRVSRVAATVVAVGLLGGSIVTGGAGAAPGVVLGYFSPGERAPPRRGGGGRGSPRPRA